MNALHELAGASAPASDRGARMHLFIVNASPLPSVGGIQAYSLALARFAVAGGHEVTLVSTTDGSLPERGTLAGCRIVRVPARGYIDGRFPVPTDVAALARIGRALRAAPNACVVVQARFYPTSVLFAGLARAARRPCVVIDHGSGHFNFGSEFATFAAARYEHAATVLLRAFGAEFAGVSHASARWLAHFGIRDAPVVSNGIDPALFSIPALAVDEPGPLRVLVSGRLVERKGVLEAIAAVGALHRRGSARVHLEVAGDGPLRDAVARACAATPGCSYLGALAHDGAVAALARAHVMLLPSTYPEGFPTVTLEAAALGRAVCATAIATGDGAFADGEDALVLRDASPGTIATALERLARDPAERARLGANARERVRGYTWPAIFEPFLARLANGPRAAHARYRP